LWISTQITSPFLKNLKNICRPSLNFMSNENAKKQLGCCRRNVTKKFTALLLIRKVYIQSRYWIRFLKLQCDERFTHAFTACSCVFKEITLVGSSQGNYFEKANAFSKRKQKTRVTTQLWGQFHQHSTYKQLIHK